MSSDKGDGSSSDPEVEVFSAATPVNAPEKPVETSPSGSPSREPPVEYEYISGMRLWLVILAVTLAAFLMLLDMSIIATVNAATPPLQLRRALYL